MVAAGHVDDGQAVDHFTVVFLFLGVAVQHLGLEKQCETVGKKEFDLVQHHAGKQQRMSGALGHRKPGAGQVENFQVGCLAGEGVPEDDVGGRLQLDSLAAVDLGVVALDGLDFRLEDKFPLAAPVSDFENGEVARENEFFAVKDDQAQGLGVVQALEGLRRRDR